MLNSDEAVGESDEERIAKVFARLACNTGHVTREALAAQVGLR